MTDPLTAVAPTGQGYFQKGSWGKAIYSLRRKQNKNGDDVPGVYVLLDPIRYVSADLQNVWTVPAESAREFETDLASVPGLASWLVPVDGTHTPAALIHDAMVGKREYDGPDVTAEEADKIFREGMQYLGVPLIRRWLMWTAVSIPTLASHRPNGLDRLRIYRWVLLCVGCIVFGLLGVLGMPDVFDVPGDLPLPSWLPIVGDKELRFELWNFLDEYRLLPVQSLVTEQSFGREFGWLLLFVALAAFAYGILWGRHFRFGLVFGLGLAFVALPLVILGISYSVYRVLEVILAIPLWAAEKIGRYKGRVSFR